MRTFTKVFAVVVGFSLLSLDFVVVFFAAVAEFLFVLVSLLSEGYVVVRFLWRLPSLA